MLLLHNKNNISDKYTHFHVKPTSPYGPMDKAPAYGAGDSGFESQYGLPLFCLFVCVSEKKVLRARVELATFCV